MARAPEAKMATAERSELSLEGMTYPPPFNKARSARHPESRTPDAMTAAGRTMIHKILPAAFAVAFIAAGCAIDHDGRAGVTTGSIKPASKPSVSKEDTLKAFCAQRHVDYQTGKSPGGATTGEQKAADDRLCEAIGRQS
jgi:hypothetical protein